MICATPEERLDCTRFLWIKTFNPKMVESVTFSAYDDDGSGVVTPDEMSAVLHACFEFTVGMKDWEEKVLAGRSDDLKRIYFLHSSFIHFLELSLNLFTDRVGGGCLSCIENFRFQVSSEWRDSYEKTIQDMVRRAFAQFGKSGTK